MKRAIPILATLFFGAPSLLYPLGRDQGMFAYIAMAWLKGLLPYRDAWDIKPPGVFAAYTFAEGMFGHSIRSCRILDLLCCGLVAVALTAVAVKLIPGRFGYLAGALYAAMYYLPLRFCDTAQAESIAAPLSAAMALLLLAPNQKRPWASTLGAGACVGGMIVFKTTFGLYVVLAMLLLWIAKRASVQSIAALLVGVTIPLLVCGAWFLFNGMAAELKELVIAQIAYASPRTEAPPPSLAVAIRFVVGQPLHAWALALGVVAAVERDPRTRLLLGATWLWFGFALATAILQRRFFAYHEIPLVAPLSLLAILGLKVCLDTTAETLPRLAHAGAISLAVALPACLAMPDLRRVSLDTYRVMSGTWTQERFFETQNGPHDQNAAEDLRAARTLAAETAPNDPVVVIAFEPSLYYLAGRFSPTRHLSQDSLLYEQQIRPSLRRQWITEFLQATSRNTPKVFVTYGTRLASDKSNDDRFPPHYTFRRKLYQKVSVVGRFRFYKLCERLVPTQVQAPAVEAFNPLMASCAAATDPDSTSSDR